MRAEIRTAKDMGFITGTAKNLGLRVGEEVIVPQVVSVISEGKRTHLGVNYKSVALVEVLEIDVDVVGGTVNVRYLEDSRGLLVDGQGNFVSEELKKREGTGQGIHRGYSCFARPLSD